MRSKNRIYKLRKKYLSPSMSLSYDHPIHIVEGKGQYLYDEKGTKYLDGVNNIQHIGHSHPSVTEAANKQLKKLNTNTRYLDETIIDYSEALLKKLPDGLNKFFFTNSGSESNDLALRLARQYTSSNQTLVLDGAYHGHLTSLIEISPYKYNGPGGSGAPGFVHAAPIPDPFRGIHRGEESGELYVNEIQKILHRLQSENKTISTFIAESIMGCGGQLIPPKGFLSGAYNLIRDNNGICIADEVQIGFGRLGKKFWGFETQKVVPDIVTLGKSIGNGHPLSLVVTTSSIAEKFNNGMEYFNSYGGNPVSCAIGHAVLKVIDEEDLQARSKKVGKELKSMLVDIKKHYDIIGDIRGMGLFIGIELIDDKHNLEPNSNAATSIVNTMKDHGILLSVDGPEKNVIKIKPPMVFNKKNAAFLVENLDTVFSKYKKDRKKTLPR
tara:strand:- start:8767 stop:10083 length:1317 start_codon:yes stop_codon:yes gene_type:complete